MTSDVEVLRERICRLESIIGSGASTQSSCIHIQVKGALAALRTQVPDEIVSARHAVEALSSAASGLRGLAATRCARIEHAEALVDRVAEALAEMDDLESAVTLPGRDLPIKSKQIQMLDVLHHTVACDIAPTVETEEQQLDRVLVDFNDATARLNSQIIALATKIKGIGN